MNQVGQVPSTNTTGNPALFRRVIIALVILLAVGPVVYTYLGYRYYHGAYALNERIGVWNAVKERNVGFVTHYKDTYFYYDGANRSIMRAEGDGPAVPLSLEAGIISCNSRYLYRISYDALFQYDYNGVLINKKENLPLWRQTNGNDGTTILYVSEQRVIYLSEDEYTLHFLDAVSLEETGTLELTECVTSPKGYPMILNIGNERIVAINEQAHDIKKKFCIFAKGADNSSYHIWDFSIAQYGDVVYCLDTSSYSGKLTRYDMRTGETRLMWEPELTGAKGGLGEHMNPVMMQISKGKLVAVSATVKSLPYSGRFNGMLLYQRNDTVYVYDAQTGELEEERQFSKHERVLYADGEKALTYYNQKIRTYDMSDWSIIRERDASYIHFNRERQLDNYYYFITSGDRIFVYDSKYYQYVDNLLDIIPIS